MTGRLVNNLSCDDVSLSRKFRNYEDFRDNILVTSTSIHNLESNYHPKKRSEPISFTRKRSNSEIQLYEDLKAAEYRDYCMYLRIHGHTVPSISSNIISRNMTRLENSLDETHTQCHRERGCRKFDSLSATTMQYPVNEKFVCHAMECGSSVSTTLPSIIMSLDSVPKVEGLNDDNDGVFDMEL